MGLVVYVRNDPVNYIDPDGKSGIPIIIIAGGIIGGTAGGLDAYWAGEPVLKGVLSGTFGGVAGAATLLTNPWISGATAGSVSSLVGHVYDWIDGKDPAFSDIVEIGADTLQSMFISRIIGDPTNIRFAGLIRARPGANPNPFTTSRMGPKSWDAIRSGGLAASIAGFCNRLKGCLFQGSGGADFDFDNVVDGVSSPPVPRTDGSMTLEDLLNYIWQNQPSTISDGRSGVAVSVSIRSLLSKTAFGNLIRSVVLPGKK